MPIRVVPGTVATAIVIHNTIPPNDAKVMPIHGIVARSRSHTAGSAIAATQDPSAASATMIYSERVRGQPARIVRNVTAPINKGIARAYETATVQPTYPNGLLDRSHHSHNHATRINGKATSIEYAFALKFPGATAPIAAKTNGKIVIVEIENQVNHELGATSIDRISREDTRSGEAYMHKKALELTGAITPVRPAIPIQANMVRNKSQPSSHSYLIGTVSK